MSSAATFIVSLIDQVTGPSHKAAKAVDVLNARLKKTGTIGYQYSGKGAVPAVIDRLNANALKTFAGAKILKPAVSGLDSVIKKTTNGIVNFATYGGLAIGAAGTALGVFAVKSAVHMGMFAESTKLAFGLLTGSAPLGERVFGRTVELSKQLGMGVEDAAHSMQKLLAMQMNPAEAEKWLKLGADLRAVGVTEPAMQRVMLDIAHVKATGKLNQRNVNMFANAGVSSQLLMEEIGKAMGTDEKGAVEAMHKGKITSAIALPALERAIMRKTHEHAAGEAGTARANTTLQGLMDRLKNAPALFGLKMADAVSSSGTFGKLKTLVDSIIGAIDGMDGGNFAKFIDTALVGLTRLVPLGMEFAKGFGEGFGAMNEAMGTLDPSKASLETAKELGHGLASAFKLAFDAIKMVADLVLWLDQHRGVAASVAGMLAIDKVAGGGTAAKALYQGGKYVVGKTLAQKAVETAAGTGLSSLGGEVAKTGAGVGGFAALKAGVGAIGLGTLGAGLAAAGGLGLAAYSYANREEFAQKMLNWWGNDQQAAQRGLGPVSPTSTLSGLQGATARAPTMNQVRFDSQIHIDGTGQDPQAIARQVGDQQRGMLEQFFQGHALEQGATG